MEESLLVRQPLSKMRARALLQAVFSCAALATAAPLPHILFVFLDDYGFHNVGWHNSNSSEVVTPTLDALAAEGVVLERHQVFKYCSPSRSAFHTGRNPIHVNVLNSLLDQHNPRDTVSGYMGIPRPMTTIPRKLKSAGYSTAMVCGLPLSRSLRRRPSSRAVASHSYLENK